MKLILSSAGFFPHLIGGGQTYVYGVAREMMKRGHEPVVLTSVPWTEGGADYRLEQYEWRSIPVLGVAMNPTRVADVDKSSELGPLIFRALRQALDMLKPDFVHLNGMKPALIRLTNELMIPHVVTAHHPGVACPTALLLRPDFSMCDLPAYFGTCLQCCAAWRARGENKAAIVGRLLGRIPRSLGRFANYLNKSSEGPYPLRLLRYPWKIDNIMRADRVILDESRLIVSPSSAMSKLLKRNGVPTERIVPISHGIDPVPRLPLEPLPGRPVRFGYVGSLGLAKGTDVILDALQRLEGLGHWEMHFFGGSLLQASQASRIRGLSRIVDNPRTVDHGMIPYENIADVYRVIDVLILPSIYLEVFGLVVLEAFSAGRPVIVSKCGGPEELVRDGVDGFVVERNDPNTLADAMCRFIEYPGLVQEMAANIRPVKTIAEYVDELEVVYRKCINTPKQSAVGQARHVI